MNRDHEPIAHIDAFIDRWASSGAAERANYALFLTQLCDLLDVPQPNPTTPDVTKNSYVFERDVTFNQGDGTTSNGRIDLYKRGCFVLEAKQGSDQERVEEETARALAAASTKKTSRKKGTALRGTQAWDDAMVRARGQAEAYAKALPISEGWPPFLVVVDVGHSIELYSDFSRSGKSYVMFPDPQSFRIKLTDLRDEKIRARLIAVWTDPLSLDPSRRSAKVTRELAERLAALAKLLEKAGQDPAAVAKFLMRCLFTMFAEDVKLIPEDSYKNLLESLRDEPENFQPMMESLWQTMNAGGFSPILRKQVLKFNGGLFAENQALPLDKPMLALLIDAAGANWKDVEPAIFGTLLERALDERERHKLGAHYTPRAYVERLVMPTIIDPLRNEWKTIYAAAIMHAKSGEMKAAQAEVREFHERLCATRVLDPACGSGNFLYVTLEHMKRLEGEVLNALRELGEKQIILQTHEVDPHQFLGIEINPRAAAIADLVLWIGYLQWHFRTRGESQPAEPIIRNYRNVECRDAVLAWDHKETVLDEAGKPVTRWDGRTKRIHPVTGEEVPDESARTFVERYVNPRKAEWPAADYVVGNPPFLGKLHTLTEFGEGYVHGLRSAYDGDVPHGVDFVMYWWHNAAVLTSQHKVRRFGFITTNSVTQTFNLRVIKSARALSPPVCLDFAIPDHPWVQASDGASVRIAMTVGSTDCTDGLLGEVISESQGSEDSVGVTLQYRRCPIHDDIRSGANLTSAQQLAANRDVAGTGLILGNRGFVITESQKNDFVSENRFARSVLFPLRNGKDITDRPRNAFVIDAMGWSEPNLRSQLAGIYQHLRDTVYDERQSNRDPRLRAQWWIFRRSNEQVRTAIAGLRRYIATPETAKHRFFVFLDRDVKPEHRLVVFAFEDAFFLGVLSSHIHMHWALEAGGTLEDRPVYNKTRCFDPFPFPVCAEAQKVRIRELAEQLDSHRKRQQSLHPKLKLTDVYNVLVKLRAGQELTAKDKAIHEQGLVSVLRELHDELDAAVSEAYGWPTTLTDDEILENLVTLNVERAAEESRGLVRWLRAEFQAPADGAPRQGQFVLTEAEAEPATIKPAGKSKAGKSRKSPWPKQPAERTKAIQDALAASPGPVTVEELVKQFGRRSPDQIKDILDALCSLGLARKSHKKYTAN